MNCANPMMFQKSPQLFKSICLLHQSQITAGCSMTLHTDVAEIHWSWHKQEDCQVNYPRKFISIKNIREKPVVTVIFHYEFQNFKQFVIYL